MRLDAYVARQLPTASRAKIAASIRAGLVLVNGVSVAKPAAGVRGGDRVHVDLLPPEPSTVRVFFFFYWRRSEFCQYEGVFSTCFKPPVVVATPLLPLLYEPP